MTTSYSPDAKTRGRLSLLAYLGVALIVALILLFNDINPGAAFLPTVTLSQIWAAFVWLCGAWLAPVLLDCRSQVRYWWLIGALGSCQTLAVLLIMHLAVDRQPLSSLIQNVLLLKVTIIVGLYGGVSSLLYVLLLRLCSKTEASVA